MTRMHFLTPDQDANSIACNFPLKINRKRLLGMGVAVRLFRTPGKEFFNCDIACVDCRFFRIVRRQKRTEEIFRFLEDTKKRVDVLLWFDTTDGTGSPQFDVLPYVTAYYKSSLLKDRAHYLNAVYSKPKFLEYYNNHFGIKDENASLQTGRPTKEDLPRIHVFWNSSLGVFGSMVRANRILLQSLQPPWLFLVGYKPPGKSRPLDITCRIGRSHKLNSLKFHRGQIAKILEQKYHVSTKTVNRRAYFQEMKQAKIGVSPFGGGEIAYRDYEIFTCGAALLKPDMSSVETWPQLYIENKSYVAHRWDFSDIDERLDYLLSNGNWRDIAKYGQDLHRYYMVNAEGRNDFCRRVIEIAERHR